MKKFLIFLSGAFVGAGGMYLFLRDKYEQIAIEEIESVKEAFERRASLEEDAKKSNDISVKEGYKNAEANHKEDVSSYSKAELDSYRKGHETNYANSNDPVAPSEPENLYPIEDDIEERPFIISPDIYDAGGSNERAILTYYKRNRLLVTENGYELNLQDTIGEEALSHFGDFEPNVVYVRNNRLGYDYEVLLDEVSEFTD